MRAQLAICCFLAALGTAQGGAPPPIAAPPPLPVAASAAALNSTRPPLLLPPPPSPPYPPPSPPSPPSPPPPPPSPRPPPSPPTPVRRPPPPKRPPQPAFQPADTQPYRPVIMPSGRMLPAGRGLDWSMAGYREGRIAIPFPPIEYNVRSFGARGDGITDDTAAIQRAVDAANASPGVIYFSPGVYILSRPFTVRRGGVVLRGAGQGLTTLHIPVALGDVYPGTYSETGGSVQTAWNSGGGFVNFSGQRQRSTDARTLLAVVDSPVAVGSTRIPVRSSARFKVGMRIRIYVNDPSTYDSAADARRRLLERHDSANSTADAASLEASLVDAPLPSSLRFLNATAPSWVLQDPVVQAAVEGARALSTGDDSDHRSGGDGFAGQQLRAPAELGAAAPTPGGALAADMPELAPSPTAEPPGAPGPATAPAPGLAVSFDADSLLENKALIDNSMPMATSAATVDEDGADVGTIAAWLYGDNTVDSGQHKSGVVDKDEVVMTARVAAVGPDFIVLDRGMPFPIKTALGWVGLVHLELPSIEDAGIERMTVRFKHTLAGQHHTDRGYNAIQVANAANFWIRNVTILNADTPIYFSKIHRSVIQDVTLSVTAPRSNPQNQYNGHHGLCITEGQMNLVTRLRVQSPFIHDITVASSASMNVVQDSAGFNLNIDHHRTAPFSNLFTNLNMGHGTRPFQSGGRGDRGAHAGRGNTYWLLRSTSGSPLVLPPCDFGPILNFVGPYQGFPCPSKGWMVRRLYTMPPNLYRAQRWKFGRQGPSR